MTGSFKYDTAAPPVEAAGNTARFMATINNGFTMNVAGVSIMSSSYFVLTQNDSPNDVLTANAGRFFHYSSGLAVNGIPIDGAAEMNLVERGDTLFSSNDDLRMLPSQNRIGQLDFDYYGLLQDHQGNFLYFGTRVPEPGAILLAAQSLCVLGRRRRMGCVVLIFCRLSTTSYRAR